MLEITGIVNDFFKVHDTDDDVTETCSATELVEALSSGVAIFGCSHGPEGLLISRRGYKPVSVPVEVWKPCTVRNRTLPDGSLWYEVSNLGRVRSWGIKNRFCCKKADTPKILSPNLDRYGYCNVGIRDDNDKVYSITVHRLVATAFLPNPHNFDTISHKNEVKTDNAVYNLLWCTKKVSLNRGSRNERIRLANSIAVRQYNLNGYFVREFTSATEAANYAGVAKQSISACCNYDLAQVCGYIWRYATSDEFYDRPVNAKAIEEWRRAHDAKG